MQNPLAGKIAGLAYFLNAVMFLSVHLFEILGLPL